MQFKGTVKDAKLSSRGINIHLLAADDCSTEIIAPEAGYDVDGFELDGE